MSTKSNENSRRMYSWWWDSHISPKNSKWLQENLTDMDSKVKQMIKLIEEDADSFARRAEMYYKKRPELMKLVEELYRAYRALAERYDNATGVIRHAHRTMSEAFPNQLPMLFGDESSAGASSYEGDPRTPEMSPLVRNGAFTEESDCVSNRQGLKQLNDLAAPGSSRARRGLNFQDGDENEQNSQSNGNHNLNARFLSESEQVSKAEAEIMALKNALAKLEAEKEASVLQCQQSMEKLSNLESEVYLAQEDSRGLNERSRKAEAEVQLLKESIVKLESEKEFSLLQYKKCLQKISDLEAGISHAQKDIKEVNVRASETEAETQALKKDLASVEIEKDTALVQYRQCLEKISYLEDRLQSAEEEVSKIKTRAEKAEVEVENLKQIISTLSKEKEASALQYQHCVDTIADLKLKLFQAQEEAQRLSRDIEDGTAKLRIAEEKCGLLENSNQTLHSELDILLQKLGNQSQELTEKQKELGRLWTSIQEEHLRFLEAETAFQTLQQLHSQSEEELRLLTAERQTRAQILKDVETRNDALQEAVQKFKEENKGLNDVNLSSAASIKSLQEEISSLRGTIEKLEAEVELRVDQRNALQQEIYCLKEELNEISQKHQAIKDQVEVVGLDPESLGSSVKELQDENSNLKVSLEKERSESTSLLEKLAVMEKLVEKNVVLGRSISDLNAEIEQIRGKVKTLEGSCESLLKEKSVLVNEKETLSSQLQISTETMGKLSKTNILLENSLLDATAELEGLRIQLRRLEDSCLQLDDEKSGLITEKENLASQLGITRNSLEDLGKQHAELTMKVLAIEKEREGSVHKIEELKAVVDVKNEEFASLVQSSQDRMGVMELQIHQLEEENRCREKEYQEELGRGICSQIEQFVLQKCLEDLFEKNVSLKVDYDGIREAYSLSERLISDKEHENREQQMQIESLADGVRILRLGLQQILERLGIEPSLGFVDEREQDLKVMGDVVSRVGEMQNILSVVQDENQHSAIQNVVLVALLRQLKSEAADIAREKRTLDREFKIQCLQLFSLQSEIQKLVKMSGKLTSEVKERGLREEALKTEVDRLNKQLLCLQDAYKELQEENIKILDEKRFLSKMVVCLEEEKNNLEDEICLTLSEALYQGSLSLILKDSILDKLSDVKNLSGDLGRLHCIKDKLEEKVHDREGKLKDAQSEYTQLCESLNKYETELSSLRYINDQFSHEITTCKDLLCQKEQELLEVAQMLSLVQNEKTVLVKEMNDLTSKHHEVSAQQKNQEKHILKLCRDFDDQVSETRRVSEAKQTLESELQKLHQELEETRQEKERLSDKVVKERIDASHWESQAAGYYENLQMSTVYEILLKGKVHELAKDLEINSASKDVEFNQLKERLSCLEDENKELKAHAAKHIQAVGLLNDSILSLENCVHSDAKSYDDVTKSSDYVTTVHAGGHAQAGEDEPLGLQSLHVRVKIIEEALREKERVLIIENSSANSKLETAMKQIEYLKSGSRRSKKKQDDDSRRQKHDRRISREEIEVVTKDIMLDQISDCSSYGTSKRATVEADDQKILETSEQTSGSDKKLEKLHKVDNGQTVDVSRRSKGKTFSEDSIIDKLEISDRFGDPNPQTYQRKVLERLDSDLQKLSNLQITVQDLKGRVEVNDNGKNKKGVEQETVKGQLEEAEEAITKLFDVNRKLTTRVEKGFSPSDGKSGDVEDNGSGRRVRISEMARRASEKIGRLQLEVQRIQFLLLKLDGEREKSKVSEKDKRVLLKDYIYSGTRSGGMKKKKASRFCVCVQPRSP